jgi:hypothetical protein
MPPPLASGGSTLTLYEEATPLVSPMEAGAYDEGMSTHPETSLS